jgi:hypothetical protein
MLLLLQQRQCTVSYNAIKATHNLVTTVLQAKFVHMSRTSYTALFAHSMLQLTLAEGVTRVVVCGHSAAPGETYNNACMQCCGFLQCCTLELIDLLLMFSYNDEAGTTGTGVEGTSKPICNAVNALPGIAWNEWLDAAAAHGLTWCVAHAKETLRTRVQQSHAVSFYRWCTAVQMVLRCVVFCQAAAISRLMVMAISIGVLNWLAAMRCSVGAVANLARSLKLCRAGYFDSNCVS